MSYFCQFCDKEIFFADSIVYVREYITCGSSPCKSKAINAAEDLLKDFAQREDKTAKLLIFKSATPEDVSTWRIVPIQDYPDYFGEDDVMHALMEGCVVGVIPEGGDEEKGPDMYYCARNTEEVLKHMKSNVNDNS